MKKQVLKRFLPLLLSVSMLCSTVSAAELDSPVIVESVEETTAGTEVVEMTEVKKATEITDEEAGEKNDSETYTSTDGFYFEVNWEGNAIITGWNKEEETTLIVPAKVTADGRSYIVDGVGESAFCWSDDVTSVQFEEGITYIGNGAFYACESLKDISLPSTLKTIGDEAFCACNSIGKIVLNDGLESIGANAFNSCDNLRVVDIPGTVKTIGEYAFYHDRALSSVALGNGITTIDSCAFRGCTNLKSIYIPKSVKTIGDEVFNDGWEFASGLTTIYCEQGSAADNADKYPEGVAIRYGKQTVNKPTFKTVDYVGGKDVYLNVDTEGAIIFYSTSTSNLTLNDDWVISGKRAFFEDFSGTIYAKAYQGGQWSEVASLSLNIPKVNQPTISISGSKATIKTTTPDCEIYYTVDGTEPSLANGTKIAASSGSFDMGNALEIKAIAVRNGFSNSEIISKVIGPAVPTLSEAKYVGGRIVTFKTKLEDAVIYYSTSNSDITLKSSIAENGESISFTKGCTIYAKTYLNGYWSNLVEYKLTVPQVSQPTFTITGDSIVIKNATAGSTIYYTTDGSTPSETNGTKASSGVKVKTYSGTLKAIAIQNGYANSVMARKVLINSSADRNVSFAVKGVFGGRNVTFNSKTTGAKIYYSSSTSTLTTSDKCIKAGETKLFEDFYGTIYARTYYNGEWGNVCRLILKIPVVNTPEIERLYGSNYNETGYVILSTSTPGCRIYYTLDGSTPSMKNGKLLNSSRAKVYVGKGKIIKAIAVRSCFTNSEVAVNY